MMNQWGNNDHGPGGDPSWLGGKDRGSAQPQGSSGWSSDFEADTARPHSDFGGDAEFGGGDVGGGRDVRSAEPMAPRFGDVTGDDARTKGEDSSWMKSFTGQQSEGSGSGRSGLSRLLGAIVPIFVLVIFGVVFMGIFSGGGFGSFSTWWILLFIGIPILSRVVREVRKHLGD